MPLSANFYKLHKAAFSKQLYTCDNYVEYADNNLNQRLWGMQNVYSGALCSCHGSVWVLLDYLGYVLHTCVEKKKTALISLMPHIYVAHLPISISHTPGSGQKHDDVIKWKHFPRSWPFVRRFLRTKASDAELWCSLWSAHE